MAQKYLISRNNAVEQYKTAHYLLYKTFPLIKDPKLLIGVIQNVFSSFQYGVDAILEYEKELKLVPSYPAEFLWKFNIFRSKCIKRNKIPRELVVLVQDLKEILDMHKKSPMEFQRGNKFVICTSDYRMHIISLNDIKAYVEKNVSFLHNIDRIIKLNRK